MYFCRVVAPDAWDRMQRPKRACTERTKQKIQEILEWETCKEDSKLFKEVEAQMQLELEAETKKDDYAPSSTSESESNESDDNCSESECEKKE